MRTPLAGRDRLRQRADGVGSVVSRPQLPLRRWSLKGSSPWRQAALTGGLLQQSATSSTPRTLCLCPAQNTMLLPQPQCCCPIEARQDNRLHELNCVTAAQASARCAEEPDPCQGCGGLLCAGSNVLFKGEAFSTYSARQVLQGIGARNPLYFEQKGCLFSLRSRGCGTSEVSCLPPLGPLCLWAS